MGKYLLLIFLLPVGFLFSQFNINEASNANGNTIVLPSGSTPDWIEIYNGSAVANNIGGFGLSDDRNLPMKWTFPTSMINPLGFLVVHAVNKNTVSFIDHYETAVFADSIWKYIIPTADIPQWNSTSFNSGARSVLCKNYTSRTKQDTSFREIIGKIKRLVELYSAMKSCQS